MSETKKDLNGYAAAAVQNNAQGALGSSAQQAMANCVTSSTFGWPYPYLTDPHAELRTLVAEMKKAMEPPTAREKRLQARVAELEAKLAEIKKAAG